MYVEMNLENMEENIKKLSKKELKYFRIMRTTSGVLYITSKPGIAKSSISKSIANKLDMEYFDLRLSMLDETDVGLFPKVIETTEGSFLDHVVPLWAHKANQQPTIIHFEELNRAPLSVRNAALQILLERTIGTKFKFNDNVLFIASGNLGSEDGTDVEEFDTALDNRLIHIKHTLSLDEWIDNYANENVFKPIIDYLTVYPQNYYVNQVEGCRAYATPRSWTFLSDYITKNLGDNPELAEVIDLIQETGTGYIGNTIVSFISYLRSITQINIGHILNNFDDVKEDLLKCHRDKRNELLTSLKGLTSKIENSEYTDYQISNIVKFLSVLSDEERASYILHLIDKSSNTGNANIKKIVLSFKEEAISLRKASQNQTKQSV